MNTVALQSPFRQAARQPALPAVSSVLEPDTDSRIANCPSLQTDPLHLQNLGTEGSLQRPRTSHCASPSTWVERKSVGVIPIWTLNTAACSAAMDITLHYPSHVDRQRVAKILNKVVTPYNADAFKRNLHRHNLVSKFPSLVYHLRHGFPLTKGLFSFPRTETPPNHPSCANHILFLENFLAEEVSLGRMSGPFSQAEVDLIYGDTFVTTPLLPVIKKGELGCPAKIRICRNSSESYESMGMSVNNFIDSDDFSTEWTTAAEVANIVRIFRRF